VPSTAACVRPEVSRRDRRACLLQVRDLTLTCADEEDAHGSATFAREQLNHGARLAREARCASRFSRQRLRLDRRRDDAALGDGKDETAHVRRTRSTDRDFHETNSWNGLRAGQRPIGPEIATWRHARHGKRNINRDFMLG
jgi:hypothetical protein